MSNKSPVKTILSYGKLRDMSLIKWPPSYGFCSPTSFVVGGIFQYQFRSIKDYLVGGYRAIEGKEANGVTGELWTGSGVPVH